MRTSRLKSGWATMDGNAAIFIGSFFGIFLLTILLGGYVFLGYRAGQYLCRKTDINRPMWWGIVKIAFVWGVLSLWPYFTDWSMLMRMMANISFFLVHAYPMAIGFGAAHEIRLEQAKRRYRKNVDDWLGEWECEPAAHLSDDED